MRIALVAEDYYPQLGGVPEHVHNLALQLNRWGHTATVVTSHMGDYPDADFVRRVGTSRVIYSNGGVSRLTTGWRLRRRLEDVFRAGRCDIVHVHARHCAHHLMSTNDRCHDSVHPPAPSRIACSVSMPTS